MEPNLVKQKIRLIERELAGKKTGAYVRIAFFAFVVMVMLIIICVCVVNIFNALYVYMNKRKVLLGRESVFMNTDDVDYDTFDGGSSMYENELDNIKKGVAFQTLSQKEALRRFVNWKRKNMIPHKGIESKVDLRVLDQSKDENTYTSKKKKNTWFWKMLFMPSEYHQYVDTSN